MYEKKMDYGKNKWRSNWSDNNQQKCKELDLKEKLLKVQLGEIVVVMRVH
jgi:hypothetical protein